MDTDQSTTFPVTLLTDGSATINGAFTLAASSFALPQFEELLGLNRGTIPRTFNIQESFEELELEIQRIEPFPSEIQLSSDIIASVYDFNQESSIEQILDSAGIELEP